MSIEGIELKESFNNLSYLHRVDVVPYAQQPLKHPESPASPTDQTLNPYPVHYVGYVYQSPMLG